VPPGNRFDAIAGDGGDKRLAVAVEARVSDRKQSKNLADAGGA
jgi:hypothetical protein